MLSPLDRVIMSKALQIQRFLNGREVNYFKGFKKNTYFLRVKTDEQTKVSNHHVFKLSFNHKWMKSEKRLCHLTVALQKLPPTPVTRCHP